MTHSRGFTLIELLVVIAIIGLLSSIVLASLSTARQRGQIAAAESDLHSFQNAFELYLDSGGHFTYPPNADNCGACSNPCDAASWTAVVNELKASGAMANPPATDPWGKSWCYDNNYKEPNCATPTLVCSSGPNGANETPPGGASWNADTGAGDDICVLIAPPQC